MDRVKKAFEIYHPKHVVLAGGVAANSLLRQRMTEEFGNRDDVKVTLPPMSCCTDNAAMIGVIGTVAYNHGVRGSLDLGCDPSLEL